MLLAPIPWAGRVWALPFLTALCPSERYDNQHGRPPLKGRRLPPLQQILLWFMQRWQVEVAFEETRAHLGIEIQRQWSNKAIARTTPALLALRLLVALLAHDRQRCGLPLPVRTAAWYTKAQTTFSDTLAWVRRWLWSHPHLSTSPLNPDMIQIPRSVLDRLTDTLCYAV